MPEEINRIVADHLARWCLAPTPTAVANLADEGIRDGVHLVGDIMLDLLARTAREVADPSVLAGISARLGVDLQPGRFALATIHRAENRTPDAIEAWTGILADACAAGWPVVLALHPGTRAALDAAGVSLPAGVTAVPPLGYRPMIALQLHAGAVLTDSGGVQREASWLGAPCLVLRSTTEWVEAVATSGGRTLVAGLDRQLAARFLAALRGAPADGVTSGRTLPDAPGAAEKIARLLDAGADAG
jgi:UDP-GlcNAc3NAcA epimerase